MIIFMILLGITCLIGGYTVGIAYAEDSRRESNMKKAITLLKARINYLRDRGDLVAEHEIIELEDVLELLEQK